MPPAQGYFWREHGDAGRPANGREPRGYFTADNAARIDAVRAKIAAWSAAGLADQGRDLLLHDLILAANDVANIAGTYGYFRATWSTASLKPLQLRATARGAHSGQHQVMQGSVEDIASSLDVDACYLDPPYTKRQYAGNYHIPETLALGDEPVAVGDGGLRDWYPQSSNFCLRRRAADAFRETLKRLETQWIFISYSEDGQVPADELLDLVSEFGRVRRVVLDIPRFRSNDRTRGRPGRGSNTDRKIGAAVTGVVRDAISTAAPTSPEGDTRTHVKMPAWFESLLPAAQRARLRLLGVAVNPLLRRRSVGPLSLAWLIRRTGASYGEGVVYARLV